MAQVVKLKRSAVAGNVPTTSDLALGELAINTTDGKLYFSKDDGSESVQSILATNTNAPVSGGLSLSGSIHLTGSMFMADGSMGIGTGSPETLGLHINKASTDTSIDLNDKGHYHLVLQNSDAASTTAGRHVGLFMQINSNSSAADASIYTEFEEDGGAKLHFTTTKSGTGQERMVIDSDGNVGIGIAAPIVPLHVKTGDEAFMLLDSTGHSGHMTFRVDDGGSSRIHFANNFRIVSQAYSNRGTGASDTTRLTVLDTGLVRLNAIAVKPARKRKVRISHVSGCFRIQGYSLSFRIPPFLSYSKVLRSKRIVVR